MLDTDYQQRLGSLITNTANGIQLPQGHEDFFEQSGPGTAIENDRRRAVRMKVRTTGILIPRRWLPAFARQAKPKTIYTKDFSKTGFGCIADQQFYPGEQVRILLATFWMEILVRRCRRLGPVCYELGGTLLERHDPSLDAFSNPDTEVSEPVKA